MCRYRRRTRRRDSALLVIAYCSDRVVLTRLVWRVILGCGCHAKNPGVLRPLRQPNTGFPSAGLGAGLARAKPLHGGRDTRPASPHCAPAGLPAPPAGTTEVGRPPPACHPCARPLRGGRETRRASPFPDSSPLPGERIKERGTRRASGVEGRGGTHRASAVEGRGGTHPETRGGASSPPSPSPLPPRGEGDKNEQRVRE